MKLLGASVDEVVASETDLFGRDAFASGLLRLFSASQHPLVVALDEKWGAGKTVFAKRFAKRSEEAGHAVVYFDAFKRDYDPDVFIGLTSELLAKFPDDPIQEKNLKEKAVAVGRVLGRMSLKVAVRALTGGLVKAADYSDAQDEASSENASDIAGIVDAELDKLIDERLSGAKAADAAFEGFRKTLQALGQSGGDHAKPLIFIIDELDRCRPDYALDVLETIKHFFLVPGVHFFLVCDIGQLKCSVCSRYGNSIDSDTYLEKFLDAKVTFPIQSSNEYENSIAKFVRDFTKDMPTDDDNGQLWTGMSKWIVRNAIRKRYTLRRIERILTQFGICMAYTSKKQLRVGAIVYILIDLKISNPIFFVRAKLGTLQFSDLVDYYEIDNKKEEWYWKWLQYIYDDKIDRSSAEWHSISSSIFQYGVESPSKLGIYFANEVVDRISA